MHMFLSSCGKFCLISIDIFALWGVIVLNNGQYKSYKVFLSISLNIYYLYQYKLQYISRVHINKYIYTFWKMNGAILKNVYLRILGEM